MRIGHSSPAFCHDPPEQTLAQVAEAGFDVWEIVSDGAHHLPVAEKTLAESIPSYDIKLQVHAPIADTNIGSLNPRIHATSLRLIESTLHTASRLDIRRITIHPGHHSPLSRGHYDKTHEATRRALHHIEEFGQDLGVDLCLENTPVNWAFETDSAEKLLDLVDGTEYGITFDIGHAHCAGRVEELAALHDRIRNVHIHDNHGDQDSHLTLDEGDAPWREVVKRLTGAGYDHAWIVESNSHDSGLASLGILRKEVSRLEAA